MCKTSKVILDLGANSGIYSLVAKSVNPSSKIHAFEPVDRVFKILKKNVSKNDFDITCHKKAVSNKDGIAFFYDDNEEFTQSVVVNMDLSETAIDRKVEEKTLHRVETETITLDTFIKENDITKIDLIKIDVETHEPEVFEGFKDNLEKFKPTLIVEIIRDHVALSLQETLSVLGYNFFYINEPFAGEDIEVEGFAYQKVDSLIGCQHGNYLICTNAIKEKLNLS